MVTRARLTQEIVNSATLQNLKKELWISDTEVRGFGLRLWASKNGQKKAYCIRIRDLSGKPVRKSIPEDEALGLWYRSHEPLMWKLNGFAGSPPEFSLGKILERARAWAKYEIRILKGRNIVEVDDEKRLTKVRQILEPVSLERGAYAVLNNLSRMRVSERHTDHLRKLFDKHIPEKLKKTRLADFSSESALELVRAVDISPGNKRTLRPFIRKIFDVSLAYGLNKQVFSIAIDEAKGQAKYEPLKHSNELLEREEFYEDFFAFLEGEALFWQQANCLRLYFMCQAPLKRMMCARWSELEVMPPNRWHPSGYLLWRYSKRRWRFANFNGHNRELLELVHEKANVLFPESDYCFPSPVGEKNCPIRTIRHVWELCQKKFDLIDTTPHSFRRRFQNSHHYWHFAR